MKAPTINKQQKWLRFLLPFPIGMVVYVLILLVFDTLNQFSSNFFSQEVLVTVLLAFVLMEALRLLLNALDKRFPLVADIQTENGEMHEFKGLTHSSRIILLPLVSLVLSVLVITPLVSVYFYFVLIISDFNTELIVFNGVYGVVAILYSVIHVSTSFLAVHKQLHYKQEQELRRGMESDLDKFKMQINPQLLYDGLENLISIVHAKPRMAEQFVNQLSKIYRYSLDNRHVELVDLKRELELSQSLLYLLNIKYSNSIYFEAKLPNDWLHRQIIPCTISALIQELVNRTIINEFQPLNIRLETKDDELYFVCNHNPKIGLNGNGVWNLSLINNAYAFFNDNKQLEITQTDQQLHINIPLFEIEEE
ncbi:histidine kinase [Carboxylicivirga mesophila]|uniref:Histidine kinase n=1 Tax=Carboxylicivirga mesophila TaxID=1166478 RepID=A0ABS5KEE6_9BACT|nr:sensor histidine kinase [Carboxylicivirga mesophila]MBS2213380.1 histidine kinase [Carboxylicivirga mesophila]